MRSAVSRFIECLSLSAVSLSEKTMKCLLDTLNENLKHPNAQIQVVVKSRNIVFKTIIPNITSIFSICFYCLLFFFFR